MMELKSFEFDWQKALKKRGLEDNGSVQKKIDSEVLRLCDPMVPKDSGELIRSGVRNTVLGSGKVIYDTIYARRWYYMSAMFVGAPTRGNYWFERMKRNGGKAKILALAKREAGAK